MRKKYILQYISAIIFSNVIVWFSWSLTFLMLTHRDNLWALWESFLLRISLGTIPFIILFNDTKCKYIEAKLSKIHYIISAISMLLLPTLFFMLHIEIGYGGAFW